MLPPSQAPIPVANAAVAIGVIEGTVALARTMEPIPNVQITLIKTNPSGNTSTAEVAAAMELIQSLNSGANAPPPGLIDSLIASQERTLGLAPGTLTSSAQTSVLTEASGHSIFENLAPGKYSIRGMREGYFGQPPNGTASATITKSVTIEAQKPTLPVDLFMTQCGIVSGRIKDPSGQPASGITVGLYRLNYGPNGRPVWLQAGSKTTDDRGEYRLFWLAPGEYYVGIAPRAAGIVPGLQHLWFRTFFPGVTEPALASAIKVKDGSEVTGIEHKRFKRGGTSIESALEGFSTAEEPSEIVPRNPPFYPHIGRIRTGIRISHNNPTAPSDFRRDTGRLYFLHSS